MPLTQCISQLDALAQGDADGWMNILFIVVVFLFWAIGGIVKAAGAKAKNKRTQQQGGRAPRKQQAKQPTWLQQLVEKAEEIQRAVEGQQEKDTTPSRPAQQPKPTAPPQGQGQIAVRTGRGGQQVLVYERQPPQSSPTPARQPQQARQTPPPRQPAPQRPQPPAGRPAPASPDFSEPPSAPREITRPVRPRARKPAPTASVASTVIDQSDPEALRRAILHYEILGKPLALRDPFERLSSS
jgi:hypothetical protein